MDRVGLSPRKEIDLYKQLLHMVLSIGFVTLSLTTHAQDGDGWPITQDCAPEAEEPPDDWTFPGVILTLYPDDGVRALRASLGSTFYVTFAGSAFVQGGALSPDGAWFAFPYGYMQTAVAFDTRYVVQEIRVHSTEAVPQLRRRIPWLATFQQNTPYRAGETLDLPPLVWLDSERLLYPQGTFETGYEYVETRPLGEDVIPVPSDFGDYRWLSPDLERGFILEGGAWVLVQTQTDERLADFPALMDGLTWFVWSADASQFATITVDGDTRSLVRYDADGQHIETMLNFTSDQTLWNFDWSPDGERLLFSLYDPQYNENRLYIGDLTGQTLTDTCVLLVNEHRGAVDGVYGAVWSPDGTQIALVAAQDADGNRFQIMDVTTGGRYGVTGYTGGIIAWGASE